MLMNVGCGACAIALEVSRGRIMLRSWKLLMVQNKENEKGTSVQSLKGRF